MGEMRRARAKDDVTLVGAKDDGYPTGPSMSSGSRSSAPRCLPLYFRESDTRHPWRDTPVVCDGQTPTAVPDRAGGALCSA
jgi:hypothetical protein